MRLLNLSLVLWENFRAQWFSLTDSTNNLCVSRGYIHSAACRDCPGILRRTLVRRSTLKLHAQSYSLLSVVAPKVTLPLRIISGAWCTFWVPLEGEDVSPSPSVSLTFFLSSLTMLFCHHWSSKVDIGPSSLTVLSQSPTEKMRQKFPLLLLFFPPIYLTFSSSLCQFPWVKGILTHFSCLSCPLLAFLILRGLDRTFFGF